MGKFMMTSWHGSSSCITGPLYGETTCHRWIPLTKGQYCWPFMFSLLLAWSSCWTYNMPVICATMMFLWCHFNMRCNPMCPDMEGLRFNGPNLIWSIFFKHSQLTHHISPSWDSHGMSFVDLKSDLFFIYLESMLLAISCNIGPYMMRPNYGMFCYWVKIYAAWHFHGCYTAGDYV